MKKPVQPFVADQMAAMLEEAKRMTAESRSRGTIDPDKLAAAQKTWIEQLAAEDAAKQKARAVKNKIQRRAACETIQERSSAASQEARAGALHKAGDDAEQQARSGLAAPVEVTGGALKPRYRRPAGDRP